MFLGIVAFLLVLAFYRGFLAASERLRCAFLRGHIPRFSKHGYKKIRWRNGETALMVLSSLAGS